MQWYEQEWFLFVSLSLKVSLALSALYLAWVFYDRANTDFRTEPEERSLPADLYIYLPRANATTLESARRKLIGIPLWVREGWSRGCEQDDRLLGPLEVVTITAIESRGDIAWARLDKDGKPCDIAISQNGRFFADEVFFIEDPVETYDHWLDTDWEKIRNHVAEPGMSYAQIGFALGLGRITRGLPGDGVVEYRAAERGGLAPVRITFEDYIAVSVTPIAARGN